MKRYPDKCRLKGQMILSPLLLSGGLFLQVFSIIFPQISNNQATVNRRIPAENKLQVTTIHLIRKTNI